MRGETYRAGAEAQGFEALALRLARFAGGRTRPAARARNLLLMSIPEETQP